MSQSIIETQGVIEHTGESQGDAGGEAQQAAPKTYDEAYVKSLREEAARYRTALREAEDKLNDATTVEQLKQAREEIAASRAEIAEKTRQLAIKDATAGLPKWLVDSVSWPEDEAGIAKLAGTLTENLTTLATNDDSAELSGGLNPSHARDEANLTPTQLAAGIPRPR